MSIRVFPRGKKLAVINSSEDLLHFGKNLTETGCRKISVVCSRDSREPEGRGLAHAQEPFAIFTLI